MKLSVYHNPRCRKSREAIKFLKENNIQHTQILYLKHGISKKEIECIIKKLKIKPKSLLRSQEKIWKELYKNKDIGKEKLIDILCEHPKLIERPIIVNHESGVIGRQIESIKSFIKNSKL